MIKELEQDYEQFVNNHPMCDFAQSLHWNQVKVFWLNEQIIIKRDQKIVLTANILIRKIPIFGNILYIPRGPIGDIYSKSILSEFTKKLRLFAKKYKAFVVLMEPDISVSDQRFKNLITCFGFKINSTSKDFSEEIQARHNLRLNIQNKTSTEIFNSFASKTRYNIRLAIKKGVIVKEVGAKGLPIFYDLLTQTAKRDNFLIRPIEYYKNLFRQFPGLTILLAYYNEVPIAGVMPLTYGIKTWYLYGASSNNYRNLMPNYLLQWEAIKLAINKNSCLYDFKGFSFKNDQPDGLYRFKKGFGTDCVELIGEVSLIINPCKYYSFIKVKKIYVKIRHFFHKFF